MNRCKLARRAVHQTGLPCACTIQGQVARARSSGSRRAHPPRLAASHTARRSTSSCCSGSWVSTTSGNQPSEAACSRGGARAALRHLLRAGSLCRACWGCESPRRWRCQGYLCRGCSRAAMRASTSPGDCDSRSMLGAGVEDKGEGRRVATHHCTFFGRAKWRWRLPPAPHAPSLPTVIAAAELEFRAGHARAAARHSWSKSGSSHPVAGSAAGQCGGSGGTLRGDSPMLDRASLANRFNWHDNNATVGQPRLSGRRARYAICVAADELRRLLSC